MSGDGVCVSDVGSGVSKGVGSAVAAGLQAVSTTVHVTFNKIQILDLICTSSGDKNNPLLLSSNVKPAMGQNTNLVPFLMKVFHVG